MHHTLKNHHHERNSFPPFPSQSYHHFCRKYSLKNFTNKPTMTISATGNPAHVLVFPYPAQGHMIPLLDLTHQLAARGLAITILVTPKNLHLLNPLLSRHPSIKTLVLPFPSHSRIPNGVENSKDLPADYAVTMIHALGELYSPLLKWFKNHPSPPVAIISDMFLGWTNKLATELNIRRLVFSPSGAKALSIIYYLWREMPKLQNVDDPTEVFTLQKIPNAPKFPWWQISPMYRSYVEGDPVSEFIKEGFLADVGSWGLVVNSFSDLERVYLDHLVEEMGCERVWAVGPLLPPDDDSSGPTERGGSSSVSVDDVLSWLDTCQDRKVVYVCFGSQVVLTNQQMEELALGLEKSQVNFIWSVKGITKGHVEGIYGTIPPGFEDRVARRGFIIRGWAPQVSILSHRAVGAFLTHCGWNSVFEGLVSGVVMLAWPMGADQFANAELLVDELKVGIRVCEGAQTVPNSSELAKAVAESVGENRVMRERAMELSKAAFEAIKGGGSAKDLDGLVKHVSGLEVNENKKHGNVRE